MEHKEKNQNLIIAVGLILSAVIFIIDLQTPLGIADGIGYIAIVALTLLLDNRKHTKIGAIIGIALTIAGYLLSPHGESQSIAITNRLLTMGATVVVAILILKYKKSESVVKNQQGELYRLNTSLRKSNSELEKKVKERTMILEEAVEELRKTKEELTCALTKEKDLNDLKSRFVSMASHEFRTPLATILSSLSLVAKYGEQNDKEKQSKHMNRIKTSVSNLTDIINDVLSISKLEEGKISVSNEPLNIRELAEEVVKEMQTISKANQKINHIHSGPNKIVSDKKILKHILFNLVSNAIKFSPEGKEVNIYVDTDSSEVKISVEDCGIGISEDDQEHLFERFFRAQNATNIQGTGLGLNIVAKYVEVLKGDINFTSQLNKGTTFFITFPLYPHNGKESEIAEENHYS